MKFPTNIKLGTAFKIDVLLHWTFFLLPVVVLWLSWSQGDSFPVTGLWMVVLATILASVLWHELGHALAARRLGIPILDILITPICGLARLQRAPGRPRDEILVALAGPVANGGVAILLGLAIWIFGGQFSMGDNIIQVSLVLLVFWINLSLFALNLLPVFPMDGGRVLRATMAMFMDGRRATWMAARLGQFLSVAAAVAGLIWRFYPLVVIGIFLLLTAEQEIRQHRLSGEMP